MLTERAFEQLLIVVCWFQYTTCCIHQVLFSDQWLNIHIGAAEHRDPPAILFVSYSASGLKVGDDLTQCWLNLTRTWSSITTDSLWCCSYTSRIRFVSTCPLSSAFTKWTLRVTEGPRRPDWESSFIWKEITFVRYVNTMKTIQPAKNKRKMFWKSLKSNKIFYSHPYKLFFNTFILEMFSSFYSIQIWYWVSRHHGICGVFMLLCKRDKANRTYRLAQLNPILAHFKIHSVKTDWFYQT